MVSGNQHLLGGALDYVLGLLFSVWVNMKTMIMYPGEKEENTTLESRGCDGSRVLLLMAE